MAREAVQRGVATFILTSYADRIDPGNNNLGIPSQVVIKSKKTPAAWIAGEIVDELRRRGVYFKRNRVFVIYGHDKAADGATKELITFLESNHLEVMVVRPERLVNDIINGLIDRMQDCAAIIAICTADDHIKSPVNNDLYQPRPNVLLEIGVALGLGRGTQRLVLLRKKGTRPEDIAYLPTDLGGLLSISFDHRVTEKFDELSEKLRTLKVDLPSSQERHALSAKVNPSNAGKTTKRKSRKS